MTFDLLMQAMIQLGAAGVSTAILAWFLHHTLTKTLPNQAAVFSAEMAAERAFCARQLRRERVERRATKTLLLAELARTRDEGARERKELTDRVERALQALQRLEERGSDSEVLG